MEMLNAPVSHSPGEDDLFIVETLQATLNEDATIGGGGSSNCNCNSNCNGSSEEPFA